MARSNTASVDSSSIVEAIRLLRAGEIISFPTETFYGLGADPLNATALARLLSRKVRAPEAGIPLILDCTERLSAVVSPIFEPVSQLTAKFWPGPLTLVVRPKPGFLNQLAAGVAARDGSVAVRVSPNGIARELAAGLSGLITATSANPHGAEPPQRADEVRRYFPKLFIVAADNPEATEQPSTILDVRTTPFRIIREGALSAKDLAAFL